MEYHLSKNVSYNFTDTVNKVTDLLKEEGFGIIVSLDMKETFWKKLKVPFRNYLILGACNPRIAHDALEEEDKIGVFLPCNVVIQEHDDRGVEISIINPEVLVKDTQNMHLQKFGTQVKQSMLRVLNSL